MEKFKKPYILALILLFGALGFLHSQTPRTIALEINIIVDGSAAFDSQRNEIVAWINQELIEPILQAGDTVTIWSAGDRAEIIHSAVLAGGGKEELMERVRNLPAGGRSPDFTGALREASARAARAQGIPYTILITSSVEGLQPLLSGGGRELLRWSRSERFERWQVYVVGLDLGTRVQQAAAAFMNSRP
ncbi:MAG: hypothetical protein FWH12_06660 [Treponema sp.]|nr:hypothetical protein [Treponema sp.]